MLQLYSNVIEGYNFMHVHYLCLFGSHVIHVVTSIQTISTIQTGREDPQCSSDVLSSCDLNLSTEQEDSMRICLCNLLNIIMEHHLKLL